MGCLLFMKNRECTLIVSSLKSLSHPINCVALRRPGWEWLRPSYLYDSSGSSEIIFMAINIIA